MASDFACDEELVRRLPLPLAQLCRRAANAKSPLERHLTAYYLWEASLKLLASTSIIALAERKEHDPELTERLSNLARPSLGHWWEFVRRSLPVLADQGDESFVHLRDFFLGRTRDDLPRTAGLDATLCDVLEGKSGGRSTVRLTELFDRLVQYRNRELGHGAAGRRENELYTRLGGAIFAGVTEILGRTDVLAGRHLLHVSDVRRSPDGGWSIEAFDLTGEHARRVPPVSTTDTDPAKLPIPGHLYLIPTATSSSTESWHLLHPLVVYDAEGEEVLFINSRRGKHKADYLGYTSGQTPTRDDLAKEKRPLIIGALGISAGDDPEPPPGTPSSEPEPTAPEPVTSRRVGEFELLSELGRGGMGIVYRAWQPSLSRQVALKCLMRLGDARSEARFTREIHALGRVEHPNLIKVFTSGADGEQWYYAMELVEGVPLSSVCDKLQGLSTQAGGLALDTWKKVLSTACEESHQAEKRLSTSDHGRPRPLSGDGQPPAAAPAELPLGSAPPPTRSYVRHIVELIRQVSEASHALHELGVIHRDIKPGNIMVTADGAHAVLMDLGLAQIADDAHGRVTKTRQFVGTLRYASPEQVLAVNALDRRSDIYSMGAALWELLTLRPMFDATEATPTPELMQKIQVDEPARVRQYNPAVSRDLEAIVARCLEKDPRRRYATARELADDLARFLRGDPVIARPVGPIRRAIRTLRKNRGAVAAALGGAALLLAAIAGWRYWDFYYRDKIEYHAKFTMRWQIPVPDLPVSSEEIPRRKVTWKVIRRGGRVVRMDALNAAGEPTTQHGSGAFLQRSDETTRECGYRYTYHLNGDIFQEIAFDRYGNIVWEFRADSKTAGHYTDGKRTTPRARGGTGAAYIEFVFNEQGRETEVRYLDKDGNLQANSEGVCISRYEYDQAGNRIRGFFFNAQDKPTINRYGFAGFRRKYDARGNNLERGYLDEQGQPGLHKEGYGQVRYRYDAWDNEVERSFFDLQGQPLNLVEGNHRFEMEYDERGNEVARRFYDTAGKLTLHKDGYAGWKDKFDDRGNNIERHYFDAEEHPTSIRSGIAIRHYQYDDQGNVVAKQYFDTQNRPTLLVDGYASVKSKFDAAGNEIENRYFDKAGRPTRDKNWVARQSKKYNEWGNVIEWSYFGPDNKPTLHKDGYAILRTNYDESGNRIEESYHDGAGKLCWRKDGYALVKPRYNEQGQLVEGRYYGPDSRPVLITQGVHGFQAHFDDRRNRTEVRFLGLAGTLARGNDGVAIRRWKYDARGHQTEIAEFNELEKPVANQSGVHRTVFELDPFGRRLRRTLFDAENNPARDSYEVFGEKTSYDSRGYASEVVNCNAAGEPMLDKYATARYRYVNDERGNRIEEHYLGLDGQPVLYKGLYAIARIGFDDRNHRISFRQFDEQDRLKSDGSGVAHYEYVNDDRGNRLEERYFGTDGKPLLFNGRFHGYRAQFNDRDLRIERTYFGPAGEKAANSFGVHRTVWEYDERGNEVYYYNTDLSGEPVLDENGLAGLRTVYNDRNQTVELVCLGADGQPTPHKQHGSSRIVRRYNAAGQKVEDVRSGLDGRWNVAEVIFRYDGQGQTIEELYFDEQHRPAIATNGFARVTSAYDDAGRVVERATYDATNKLTPDPKEGYARWTKKYDSRGNLVELVYFGTSGAPAPNNKGIQRYTARYDEQDRLLEDTRLLVSAEGKSWVETTRYNLSGKWREESYSDEQGNAVPGPQGYSRRTRRFDAQDRTVLESHFDADGRLAPGPDGYVQMAIEYDDDQRTAKFTTLDASGKPWVDPRGYASMVTHRDAQGNNIESATFDSEGRPTIDKKVGYARITRQFDDHGNVIDESYFDPEGKPQPSPSGAIRWQGRYDEKNVLLERIHFVPTADGKIQQTIQKLDASGTVTEEAYADEQGRPVRNAAGYARKAFTFDETNRLMFERYFAEDGRPLKSKDGYAEIRHKFDNRYNVLETAWFDEVSRPVRGKFGYARAEYQYDAQNVEIDARFFDEADHPLKPEVVVEEVFSDSQAERLGIKVGDIFVKYDGKSVENMSNFIASRRGEPQDDPPRELVVRRGDKEIPFQVKPGPIGTQLTNRLPDPRSDDPPPPKKP